MIQKRASESLPLVLIVEDEEPIAQALAYVVEDAGYRTLIATDGKAALALERAHRPALIITDLMMPRMNGRDLIAALRATDDHATPPVVLMTAAGARFTENIGADATLSKPFDIADVEALLARFIGRP